MFKAIACRTWGSFALLGALSMFTARAASIKTVLVIAMENHNWTQPINVPDGIQPIYGNPNAPFINSLVSGSALAIVDGSAVNISQQVAYRIPQRWARCECKASGHSSFRAQLPLVGSGDQLWRLQR